MDPSDRAVMSMRETKYAIFELKVAQAQDKAVEERTNWKTKDFKEYCKIPGICVPTRNVFNCRDCIEEERAQHKKQEKEAAVKKETKTKLERNGSRKIIYYVGRVLVAPDQSMSQTKVHIYQTFFMSRLHNEGAG